MANLSTYPKKYCPYCLWTSETNLTHCPNVGNSPRLHYYHLSVPLEICKPDTTNAHKSLRRQTPTDDPEVIKRRGQEQIAAHGGLTMPLKKIRELQRKARFEGKINDGHDIPMD